MFILRSVRDVSPSSAAEKLCYDIIFPKLPVWEASHSESHKSGLPAGHQLFTTCSFTSSRRICIIYSSPWRLLGWTVSKHRDKTMFLWAFARGWLEGKTPQLWKMGTSAKRITYRSWTFLHNLSWQHLEYPVPLHACSYSSSLAIFCALSTDCSTYLAATSSYPLGLSTFSRGGLVLDCRTHQAMWMNNRMQHEQLS